METMRYKPSDKVRIKSLDWYNENKDKTGRIRFKYENFIPKMSQYCGEILTIKQVEEESECYLVSECGFAWTDEMIECKVEEETIHNKWTGLKVELELSKTVIGVSNVESVNGERFMAGFVKAIIPPDGYIFKDENGNVIETTKIVLEKKQREYPKTYKECEKILGLEDSIIEGCLGYEYKLLNAFQKLLMCRDAYWKIAGEEMGLDEPWKPDWDNISDKYCIYFVSGHAWSKECQTRQCPFAFPTPEMRDAFEKNFDPDIEICKELL